MKNLSAYPAKVFSQVCLYYYVPAPKPSKQFRFYQYSNYFNNTVSCGLSSIKGDLKVKVKQLQMSP